MQRARLLAERYGSGGPPAVDLYHRDFRAWALEQARALRRARDGRAHGNAEALQEAIAALDLENLAEEVGALAKSESRELRSRLATIVEHLLKAQHSPAAGPLAGWRGTVQRSRAEISRLLENSPSLKAELPELLDEAAVDAVGPVAVDLEDRGEGEARELAGSMREALRDYTPERVLDPGWWPPMEREDAPPAGEGKRKRLPVAPPKRSGTKRGGT